MPNIKSAKKRVKVTAAKTLQNKMFRTQLKTEMKKYEAAVAAGDLALVVRAETVWVYRHHLARGFHLRRKRDFRARELHVWEHSLLDAVIVGSW